MKIIIATPFTYPFHIYGGLQKYIFLLAKALSIKGVDVEIVSSLPKERQKKEIYEGITYTFIAPHINWDNPSIIPTIYHLPFTFNVARYLRKQKFDILHGYGIAPHAYLRLKKRAPVVFQPFERIYNNRVVPMVGDKTGWFKRNLIHRVIRYFDLYSITHADAVAAEGDFQNETLTQLLGNNQHRIFNLPVGVDIPSVEKALKLRSLTRDDLGLNDNDFLLISVNRLYRGKGVDYLIDAFALVKREIGNAKLIIIGTGPEEESIVNHIAASGLTSSVLRFKNVPEDLLYQYYALSDIYVSPTWQSGSIMSIVEAMACGMPVVATGQDFWVKSGENGYVVPPKDSNAIAQAILKMHKLHQANKLQNFIEKSRMIAKEHDYSIIATLAVEKYRELIEERKPVTASCTERRKW